MAAQGGNENTSARIRHERRERAALSRRQALLLAAALGALSGACACRDEPAPRSWPAGTVVAIDDVPVTSDEIAQDVLAVMLVSPESGDPQLKRLAFNEIALLRAVLRTRVTKAARDEARRSLDEQFARLVGADPKARPDPATVVGREVKGALGDLGLTAWGAGMNLAVGEWSEVLEEPGAFLRVRLLERKDGAVPAASRLRLDRLDAVYAQPDPTANEEPELRRHRLTIVDPKWDTIVPEVIKYWMGVHDS